MLIYACLNSVFTYKSLTVDLTFYNMFNELSVLFNKMTNQLYTTAAYLLSFLSSTLPPISIIFFFPINNYCPFFHSHRHPILHGITSLPPLLFPQIHQKLKAIDRPQELEKVPRAPHDRKKEWQKMALGAELAQDVPEDKHREANGSAVYHDNRCVKIYL